MTDAVRTNHFWRDVDADDTVEMQGQRLTQPTHATAEVQCRLATNVDAKRTELIEQERHFAPARFKKACEIPPSFGFRWIRQDRPEWIVPGKPIPERLLCVDVVFHRLFCQC